MVTSQIVWLFFLILDIKPILYDSLGLQYEHVTDLSFVGRRKMAQFVIKEHFGHVTPNRIDVKMDMKITGSAGGSAKPAGNTTWTQE